MVRERSLSGWPAPCRSPKCALGIAPFDCMPVTVPFSRPEIGEALGSLETPCLVLEKSRLIANVERLKRHLRR